MGKRNIPGSSNSGREPDHRTASDGTAAGPGGLPLKVSRYAVLGAVLALGAGLSAFFPVGADGAAPELNILYPKNGATVGRRVNIVIDPTTDWSTVPAFQVVVGSTEYPVVDTSSGRHAFQGIDLDPGVNSITVRVISPAPPAEPGKAPSRPATIVTRTLSVFNREESFGSVPAGYEPRYFHTRDQESECSGCHRLEVEKQDRNPKKPDQILCNACHREIPKTKNVHGPAAVWDCLTCHDPELYPVKYQFTTANPWTATKSSQPVEPVVYAVAADDLFKPQSAVLLSDDIAALPKPATKADRQKQAELKKARDGEIRKRKDKEKEYFQAFLDYVKQYPGDKIRIEAHVDDAFFPVEKGKKKKGAAEFKKITNARARAVAKVLASYGISGKNRVVAEGMGNSLPKMPNTSPEARKANNRIEIVVHPPDVQVKNSQNLPQLTDRERITINVSFNSKVKTGSVKGLKVVERLPKGIAYLKNSGSIRGAVKDPQVKGDELRWSLGDVAGDFQESVSFIIKRDKAATVPLGPVVRLQYLSGRNEETRDIDPLRPDKGGKTVQETCEKCHGETMSGPFRHGPAIAGYCTLCHDPHGSDNAAWLRMKPWELCTTCHREKMSDVHVIAGFVKNFSHPTRKVRDPLRPGKKLSCVSCHSPHSAESKYLLAYGVRNELDLCGYCHKKK